MPSTETRINLSSWPAPRHLNIDAWVRSAGHYIVRADATGERVIPDAGLVYVVRGTATYTLNENTYWLQPGDMYYVPRGELHAYASDADSETFEIYYVYHGGDYASKLLLQCGLTPSQPVLRIGVQEALIGRFERILQMMSKRPSDYDFLISYEFIGLLIEMVRCLPQVHFGTSRIMKSVTWEVQSVDELAKKAGYSKYHFIRVFKRVTGTTPWDYILGLKINKAASLLRQQDLNVSEVAASVGFDDPNYFSRLFRKRMRMSPSAYRTAAGRW